MRMTPAEQGFESDEVAAREVDDGLVVDVQLTAKDRASERLGVSPGRACRRRWSGRGHHSRRTS
jgi:hypothetical protein